MVAPSFVLGTLDADGLPLVWSCLWKITAVLAAAALVALVVRRCSAARRCEIWIGALVATLLIPPIVVVLPAWRVLPVSQSATVAHVFPAAQTRPTSPLDQRTSSSRSPALPADDGIVAVVDDPPTTAPNVTPDAFSTRSQLIGSAATVPPRPPGTPSPRYELAWAVFGMWTAGVGLALVRLARSYRRLQMLERSARLLPSGRIADACGSIQQRLGLGRPPRVLISDLSDISPLVWRPIRAVIILPAGVEQWSAGRLRAVLTHEMSHIARHDPLMLWIVQLAGVLYWFHPLVWLAAWRVRVECERACDDVVLQQGTSATDYAEHLLHIAAGPLVSRRPCAFSLAMSGPHRLEGRLRALFDRTSARGGTTCRTFLSVLSMFLAVATPLGMLRAGTVQEQSASVVAGRTDDDGRAAPVRIGYVDNSAEGRRSMAGTGHAIEFIRPRQPSLLMAVEVFASRYGTERPPAEDFHLYLLDEQQRLVQAIPFPYSMIERGPERWYTLRVPAVKVPERFMVALSFNPHQTKGVYLGYDESVDTTHSFTGRPTQGYRPLQQQADWMIRAVLVTRVPRSNPFELTDD